MFDFILYFAIAILSFRTILFYLGFRLSSKKAKGKSNNNYFLSIIVPARNEESHIERTICSLLNIDYPKDKYEIILVNDRSEDRTLEIMQKYHNESQLIKIVNITSLEQKGNLKGKAGALQAGADIANGDLLLMTDADCTVNKDWAKTIANLYSSEKVGMTAGYTLIEGTSFFATMQAAQWAYMHTLASSGIGLNQPLGCFGNNVSIRKSLFEKLGGYNKIKFSVTEDLALLQAVFNSGYEIRYSCDSSGAVYTLPCLDVKELYHQQQRWSRGGIALGWRAVFFVGSSSAMWVALVASLACGRYDAFFGMIALRFFSDFLLNIEPLLRLKSTRIIKYFIPAVFFFLFAEVMAPISLINKKVIWKGQEFK